MKHLLLILSVTSVVIAQQPNKALKAYTFEKVPEGVELIVKEGRFAAYSGFRNPIQLDSKLRAVLPKTYSEALSRFGPAFINSDSGSGIWQWTFSDNRTLTCSYPQKLSDSFVDLKLSEPSKMHNNLK